MKEASSLGALNTWIEDFVIPEAEKVVDGYCNHAFGTPSYGTFNLDGSGKQTLFFPPKWTPLIGVSAGSVDGTGISVTSADLHIYNEMVRRESSNFPEGKLNVVFYGSYGYLDKDRGAIIPRDVEYVTAQLSANVLLDLVRRNKAPDFFADFLAGGGGGDIGAIFAMPTLFSKNLKVMLDPYHVNWVEVG